MSTPRLGCTQNQILCATVPDPFLLSKGKGLTTRNLFAHNGADIRNAKLDDAGQILWDLLRRYMQEMGAVNGLPEMGYISADIPGMVQGTLPQVHLVVLVGPSLLLLVASMVIYLVDVLYLIACDGILDRVLYLIVILLSDAT